MPVRKGLKPYAGSMEEKLCRPFGVMSARGLGMKIFGLSRVVA
jgi:hypothetical protein